MLHDTLLRVADSAPRRNGLRSSGKFWSYPQLAERAQRLAGGLAERGIGAGDAVALVMPNGPEIFVACHALFALGAVAMPLSLTATREEIFEAARKANARAIISHPQAAAVAQQAADELALQVFLSGDSFGELESGAPANLLPVAPEAPALYLLSSGSTGRPKIVPHSHAELIADARRTSTAWGYTAEDIVFDMLPSNFAMGLLMGVTGALVAEATVVYWHDALPLMLARQRLLQTLVDERVTFMGAVPAMYETLAGARGDYDLGAMRLAFAGGAAMKRPLFETVRDRFGISLRQDYGSTEAIFVAHNDSPDPDATWDSVGRPAGDAEVRIAPMDTDLGPDVGELLVRSSSMTKGYLNDPQSNATTFEDGWQRSGDLARLDADGNIYIKGRSKLLIEVSGYKIDPIEVEDALLKHPAVAEAAVIGVRDTRRGEQRLKAIVVRSDSVTDEQLLRHVRELLSVHKVPAVVEFRDTLPKSSAGKILRGQLVEPS